MGVAFGQLYLGLLTCLDPASAWEVRSGALTANVELMAMNANGTVSLPSGTRRIFIEVGANSIETIDEQELSEFPDAFVLSFEPLLHQYAALLARKNEPGWLRKLGEHHPRGAVLPFAVGPEDGETEFHVGGQVDFCASLLKPRAYWVHQECANPDLPLNTRTVPVVSLATVLGAWLAWENGEGWSVDFLKVDVQGYDVDVIASAGKYISRILRVELEVYGDSCERMYWGSLRCSEVVERMMNLGFLVERNQTCASIAKQTWTSHFLSECHMADILFHRPGVRPWPIRRIRDKARRRKEQGKFVTFGTNVVYYGQQRVVKR